MNSTTIKSRTELLGASLVGIATIERFNDAPTGFNPKDLFPQTQSVIAIARQVPRSTLLVQSGIPYTVTEKIILDEVHRIAVELTLFIEAKGYEAIIVPSEPYEYWDNAARTGRGLVSLKHIAHKCGLGVFGKNHLLYNPKFGNLIKLGAVLTNAVLEADEMIQHTLCNEACTLCIDSCPAGAITEAGVNQAKCREHSGSKTLKGDPIYVCNVCRRVCPNVGGCN